MLSWEPPVFNSPYELDREHGVLRLVFPNGTRIDVRQMKELLRLTSALATMDRTSLLVECREGLHVTDEAQILLRRVCDARGHAIAVFTEDLHLRLQAEVFRQVHQPRFTLRVFGVRANAQHWSREKAQQAEMDPAMRLVEKSGDILPVAPR